MKYYIVTMDRKPELDYREFHTSFIGHNSIFRWWHYLKSSYVIGTFLTVNELADHFAECAKKHGIPTTHLVLSVNLTDRQGRLSEESWDWFRKQE